MQRVIKEYSLFKEILERNSEYVRLSEESPRVKSVDCQLLHTMF
jgi:hypothetical protein